MPFRLSQRLFCCRYGSGCPSSTLWSGVCRRGSDWFFFAWRAPSSSLGLAAPRLAGAFVTEVSGNLFDGVFPVLLALGEFHLLDIPTSCF